MITLEEAIVHAKEVSETRNDMCEECRDEHKQLAEWLEGYLSLQEQASRVYEEVTGGLLSKPNYPADTVISVYKARQEQLVDKATTCEDILSIIRDAISEDTSGIEDLIKEYFGV